MLNNWQHLKLAEVVNIIGGGTPKRSVEEYWGGDIPWLSVKDFNNDYRMVSQSEETITELGLQKSSTKLLSEGQIIISARGTVGELAQVTKPMAFNQSCYGIDAKPEYATNDFVYYLLKNSISNIQRVTHGAVFDTITRDTFNFIEVLLPPLPEQKAIAHILGTLDDKIELNRQMNETLEAIAQALFKSWFVDFDPVIDNALLVGKAIPDELAERAELRQAQLDSGKAKINSEINDLFPSEFEFTEELGWIPQGWEVSNINTEFEVTMGQSPPGSSYNEEQKGIAFFQGSTDFGFRYPTNRIYTTEPKRLADKDDTLVSVRAPVGTVNMATQKCCIGRGLSAVRHKSGNRSYTYYSMIQLHQRFQVFESQGTVFGSINQKDFKALLQIKAPDNLLNKFEEYAGSLDNKIETNSLQIITLANLRDTLLPKLMSGELRIVDAEKLVEDIGE